MRAGQLPYGDSSEPGQAVLANNLILLKTRHNAATQYPPPLCRWPGTAGMPTEFGYSRPQRLCAQLQDLPSYMHYHVGKRMSGIGCQDKIVIRLLDDPTFRCIVKHREHSRLDKAGSRRRSRHAASSPCGTHANVSGPPSQGLSRRQQRILTAVLEVAPVARLARKVDSTGQHDIEAASARFITDHPSCDESYTNRHRYAPKFHWSPLTNTTTMGYEPTEHRSRCRLRAVAFFATLCQV
jgi:hypothetical protein